MVNRSAIFKIIVLLAVVAVASSCILDPKESKPEGPPPPPVEWPDLTQKDDILFSLEMLFNSEFNESQYDKLLDDDFVFFFSDADFSSGKTPEQWTRETEIQAYKGFYNPNRTEKRVIGRSLKLTYPDDNWTEITPDDPVQYPDESWFFQTVTYNMSVEIDEVPSLTLVANDIKLEVTIRWDPDKGHYRMIRWRDDVDAQ